MMRLKIIILHECLLWELREATERCLKLKVHSIFENKIISNLSSVIPLLTGSARQVRT